MKCKIRIISLHHDFSLSSGNNHISKRSLIYKNGGTQGSILDPFFFITSTNYLTYAIKTT